MVPCPVPNLKCLFESKLSLSNHGRRKKKRERREEKRTHKRDTFEGLGIGDVIDK